MSLVETRIAIALERIAAALERLHRTAVIIDNAQPEQPRDEHATTTTEHEQRTEQEQQ